MSSSKVYDDIKNLDIKARCLPTFEELRDVEMARVVGANNMFATDAVMYWLFERDLFCGVTWLDRCRRYRYPCFKAYDEGMVLHKPIHGDPKTWFTKKELRALEITAAKNKLRKAEQELAESYDEDE